MLQSLCYSYLEIRDGVHMLVAVSGRDYLTFESFDIVFSEGLNVITGESGSGKTVLLKAIQSLVGLLPSGSATGGYVEGVFVADGRQKELLSNHGHISNDELSVSVDFTGQRVVYRINGRLVSRQLVQEVLGGSLEVHSQHSTVRLLDPSTHHVIIDNAITDRSLLQEYRDLFGELIATRRRLSTFSHYEEGMEREKEILQFQIDEIDRTELDPERDNEIEKTYMRMRESTSLKETSERLMGILRVDESSAYARLNEGVEILQDLGRFGYEHVADKVIEAINALQQACKSVEKEMNSLEIDEESLKIVEARINSIQELKRKYGSSIDDILQFREVLKRKLTKLQNAEEEMESLAGKDQEIAAGLWKLGKEIDRQRAMLAEELVISVKKHLRDLRMEETDLRFFMRPEDAPKAHGTSRVVLEVKTRASSPFTEIGQIASGGELSRFLIAIECALKDYLPVSSIVFDEIDVGVGQRMGDIMAAKMRELSHGVQTIVITHLPQVAQIADAHFAVSRTSGDREFVSVVSRLEGKSRKEEINEMSGKRIEMFREERRG